MYPCKIFCLLNNPKPHIVSLKTMFVGKEITLVSEASPETAFLILGQSSPGIVNIGFYVDGVGSRDEK